MQNFLKIAFVFLSILFVACGSKDNGARMRLDAARLFYEQKEFGLAKLEIDSLNKLYPKAIEERKASLLLLDSVRRAESIEIIANCDTLITATSPELDKKKNLFSLQRNKEYQEKGTYIPKETASSGVITSTILRSGVGEDGVLFLESVFVGSKQKHDKIKVSKKDGTFAQSLPVTDDGANYRFSNLGKDYEIIRFTGNNENNVAKFIFANAGEHLTVTLEGQGKYSYTLSPTLKNAIAKSYELSSMMLQLDSLKTAKEKAEFHIYNLDKKDGKIIEEEIIE